ncbi:TPA: hypothetical protein DDZ10_03580 [Candidatus Uhrbacteria bacterium]|uniref:DUF948 domain-containing protein n=1 Tax=Candidatus Uhrbacteria bacterium GW2011_GWC2_53_7 TaxID=1618986 RepID=A0A0G1Y0X5_9BACT|nr:MAG: hypothetical protein UY79_C0007G0032 [Parcubacteria group bacterium GW2011_GWA2_53_21]KKW36800.1 MAG: hypothetical protein UY82_C0011G0008 [Candidatus Uhrbacteria bacterium GW2011_GWC2_53_7]HBL39722.1 hypothetical protein [Candidatus Uhrbacteria bacterium]
MLEAKDILLIVLAFCALWFTAFVCWLVYQIAAILKNVNDIVADAHETLGKMERALSGIRGRFDHAVSGLMLAIDGGQKIMELLGKRRERVATKKSSSKKK